MTQDERWLEKYNEVKDFIVKNKRNPSRHNIEDHLVLNWIKHNRKLLNKGELRPDRIEMFKELLVLIEDDNSAMNVPSRAFSNVPSVTDSNVPLQMWLL